MIFFFFKNEHYTKSLEERHRTLYKTSLPNKHLCCVLINNKQVTKQHQKAFDSNHYQGDRSTAMKNKPTPIHLLLNWRLHFIVIIMSVVSEWIGVRSFPIGTAQLLFMPLFYSFILCIFVNPNIIRFSQKIINKKNAAIALQELGNLATMLVAMPVAVLVFKMGREAIGATYSIAREPNIALISNRYGLKSNEGVGVMSVYVMGTLFGTIYFALMAGFLATTDWFNPMALAMACGVGSSSMTAACSGTLAVVSPLMRDDILAFAGASNVPRNLRAS